MNALFSAMSCLLSVALLHGASLSSITIDEVVHEGQSSYRITTPTATWVYHREGAGFASLVDAAGTDWISYRPEGGASGHYRGMPNAVFRPRQPGNNFFHPGHSGLKGAETHLVVHDPHRVVLRSRSQDGRWACEWEILPDRARFRMTKIPKDDHHYWFLYEGTPGGRFDAGDLCLRPDGSVTTLGESWEGSTTEVPWLAFISSSGGRALVLVAHDAPDSRVSYWPMENAMTVFGFGRRLRNVENLLSVPVSFTVALIAETDPARISESARALQ